MFSENEMAGGIIEVAIPPVLGLHVVDNSTHMKVKVEEFLIFATHFF